MKKDLTELVMILDMSGSMHGLKSDTVGGYNAMLEKQKKETGECLVSTVFFNTRSFVIHDRVPIAEVRELTEEDYRPNNATALIDALGDAIRHIRNVHKYIREEDLPEHTLFVIVTDGMENASSEYSSDYVKELIMKQKMKGWEFLFLGANIDAVETARHYGIGKDRAVEFISDRQGTKLHYETISETVVHMRRRGPIDPSWEENIEYDRKKRGGR